MHASITHLPGDPEELQSRYDSLLAQIGSENLDFHMCLRAPDGLVVVDACPSEEAFREFHHGEAFRELRAMHGLPDPDRVDDYPVHAAFARGAAVAEVSGN
jgi:hypothetical protein